MVVYKDKPDMYMYMYWEDTLTCNGNATIPELRA